MTTYKQVLIELHTTIDDNGQMEYNTIHQTGRLYQKNAIHVLKFREKTEDETVIDNLLTIHPDKVTIKRSGDITMNQQFRTNRMTENVFRHPYGTINMETFTSHITHHPLEYNKPGRLELVYTVKLNGGEERKHRLTLTYTTDLQNADQ